MHRPSLSIVVMAHNECANVPSVLAELRAWLEAHEPDSEIVFVDDGSTDDTGQLARNALHGFRAIMVRHGKRTGMGAALKSGVYRARGEWVTFLPADGQIAPEAVGALRDAAHTEGADVVLSVYRQRNDGALRKLLSAGVRGLILLVHGIRLRSDGPYLFRRSLFLPHQLTPESFFLNFEFPIRVLRAGLRVATATIECRPRQAGVSKSAGWGRVVQVASDLLWMRARMSIDTLRRGFGTRDAGRSGRGP